jgi:hypothetical protein
VYDTSQRQWQWRQQQHRVPPIQTNGIHMKVTEATDSTVYSRISLYTHLGMDNTEESTMLLSDNTGI